SPAGMEKRCPCRRFRIRRDVAFRDQRSVRRRPHHSHSVTRCGILESDQSESHARWDIRVAELDFRVRLSFSNETFRQAYRLRALLSQRSRHRHGAGFHRLAVKENMNTIIRVLLITAVALTAAAPLMAHHSAAAYDTQKEVTVNGTVTKYSFKNPHIYM